MKNALLRWHIAILMPLLSAMSPSENPKEILLWPNGAPGSQGKTGKEKVRVTEKGEHVISFIHAPSITPYLPAAEKANGAAIIIAPGGGQNWNGSHLNGGIYYFQLIDGRDNKTYRGWLHVLKQD